MGSQFMLDPFIVMGFCKRSFYLLRKQRWCYHVSSLPCSPVLRFTYKMSPHRLTFQIFVPQLLVLIGKVWLLEKVTPLWQKMMARGKTLQVIPAPDCIVLSASRSLPHSHYPNQATFLFFLSNENWNTESISQRKAFPLSVDSVRPFIATRVTRASLSPRLTYGTVLGKLAHTSTYTLTHTHSLSVEFNHGAIYNCLLWAAAQLSVLALCQALLPTSSLFLQLTTTKKNPPLIPTYPKSCCFPLIPPEVHTESQLQGQSHLIQECWGRLAVLNTSLTLEVPSLSGSLFVGTEDSDCF